MTPVAVKKVEKAAPIEQVKKGPAEILREIFFPPAFFEQAGVIEKILVCCSVEEFNKLGLKYTDPVVKEIFKCAGFSDSEAKVFTQEKLAAIFKSLKPIRSSEGFI